MFLCAGILLIAIFLVPAAVSGSISAGNISGMFIGAALAAPGLCPAFVRRSLQSFRAGHPVFARMLTVCFFAAAAVIAATVSVETMLMVRAMNIPAASENSTVLVLCCKVAGSNPGISLNERIETAARYLCFHPELPAVLSGGQGPGEAVSEAECMRRELIRRGIAPERLYIEDASASTYENIVFSKRIIEQNGLPSDIVIITNGYHAFRASCIARDLGMRRGTYSACTALWMLPPFYVRELYAVLYHFFMMHNPFLTHASDCDFASE